MLRGVRDAVDRELVLVDFKPIKESKIGELAATFDIVVGVTPAEPSVNNGPCWPVRVTTSNLSWRLYHGETRANPAGGCSAPWPCCPRRQRSRPAAKRRSRPRKAEGLQQFVVVVKMMAFNKKKDGKLTKDEVTDPRLHRLFDLADTNKDGVVTKEELMALAAKLEAEVGPGGGRDGPGRGQVVAVPGGPGGPGGRGPGGPPQPGQVMPEFVQETLNLTDDQKKQVAALQKDVDGKLDKILTDEQKKQFKEMKDNPGRGGPGGPGGVVPVAIAVPAIGVRRSGRSWARWSRRSWSRWSGWPRRSRTGRPAGARPDSAGLRAERLEAQGRSEETGRGPAKGCRCQGRQDSHGRSEQATQGDERQSASWRSGRSRRSRWRSRSRWSGRSWSRRPRWRVETVINQQATWTTRCGTVSGDRATTR